MSQINQELIISEKTFLEPSTLILDSEKRIRYNNSFWHSIFHHREKRELNHKMWQTISGFFQERYSIKNPEHFKRVWKEIGHKRWTVKSPFTVEHLRAIDDEFKRKLIYHGPGIFPINQNTAHKNSAVQKIVNSLLHGGALPLKSLLQKSIFNAVFVKHDPTLLKKFCEELQLELNQLAKNPPLTMQEEIVWRQFLGNVLALLPFTYPHENETFFIPYLEQDGTCRQLPYTTHVMELTAGHETTSISAIALSPISDTYAPSILSFIGTTYPAGDGFSATIKADFTPKMSVGEDVYRQGKEKIAAWFKDKTNVHVVGTSLGGAMAFHTILDHYQRLTRADIYNPPGLYAHCWKERSFNDGCHIHIYRQPGDIVSKMGFWPTGSKVHLFDTIPHQKGIKEKMPRAHAQVFSGCQRITLLKSDPAEENKSFSRKALVFLHRYFGPYVFYYPTCFILCCSRIVQAARRFFS